MPMAEMIRMIATSPSNVRCTGIRLAGAMQA